MRHPGVAQNRKMGFREMSSKMVVVVSGPFFLENSNLDRKCQSQCFCLRCPRGVQRRARSRNSIQKSFARNLQPRKPRSNFFNPPGPLDLMSEGEWGVGSVVVEFRVFGAPRFSVQRSQNTYFKRFWDLWTESQGALKTGNSTTTDRTPHSWPSDIKCCFTPPSGRNLQGHFFVNFSRFFPHSLGACLVGRFEYSQRNDSRFEETTFLRIDLPKTGIAARIGLESHEFQCESERGRDSPEMGRIWPSASKIGTCFANRFARICETLVCESPGLVSLHHT